MAYERVANSGLLKAFADLFGDFSDLVQKEIRLAKAEVTDNVTAKLMGGVWMAAAGLFSLLALVFVLEAAVFALASFGLELHWACLIVAAVLAATGAALFFGGRSLAGQETPRRVIGQVARDIKTAKEQLT